MRQIYKFPASEPIIGKIEKFLHVEYQGNDPMIWAIVNDNYPVQRFAAICSGTGWPLADFQNETTYIGTLHDGGYVWHYFIVPADTVERAHARSYDKVVYKEEPEKEEDDEFEIDEETIKAFHAQMLQYLCHPQLRS